MTSANHRPLPPQPLPPPILRPRLRHSYDAAQHAHQQRTLRRRYHMDPTTSRRQPRPVSLPAGITTQAPLTSTLRRRRQLPSIYVDWPNDARDDRDLNLIADRQQLIGGVSRRDHDLCAYYNISDECCLVTKAHVAEANSPNGGILLVLPPKPEHLDYLAMPTKGQPYWGKMVPCYVYSMQLVNGHVMFTYAT